MRLAYFDCPSGAAGDMILGAAQELVTEVRSLTTAGVLGGKNPYEIQQAILGELDRRGGRGRSGWRIFLRGGGRRSHRFRWLCRCLYGRFLEPWRDAVFVRGRL